MFTKTEKSEYKCPKCDGAMNKVTEPINVFVFICAVCDAGFEESYLVGWDAAKKDSNERLEGIIDRMADRLAQYVTVTHSQLELCWEIEKLPASEQQTKCSVMASDIHKRLKLSEKTTEEQGVES